MDSTIATSMPASSTVTESCISSLKPPPSNIVQLLEISLISAQDLAPISKSMQTYAVAWINPNRKRTTQTDQHGHRNPEWNDKFIFRLDNGLEDAMVTVEIYAVSWLRDVLVGTVRVLISDLIAPLLQTAPNCTKQMRFIRLQVRRPSGSPQGILDIGVALLDSTLRSMPLHNYSGKNFEKNEVHDSDHDDDDNKKLNAKIHLWRSMSTGSNEDFTLKQGSVYNGSAVNGSICDNASELCSDIGPSASVVAGELYMKLQPPPGKAAVAEDTCSSILLDMTFEEAKARGYRVTRRRMAASSDDDEESELSAIGGRRRRHSRRKSEGSLFSCFAYGMEFTVVCGSNKKPRGNRSHGNSRRKKPIEVDSD